MRIWRINNDLTLLELKILLFRFYEEVSRWESVAQRNGSTEEAV